MASERKTAILQAFQNRVSRVGFDKTTMADVARDAGVSVGAIYKDFANKEELVDACIEQLYDWVIERCRRLVDEELEPEASLHHFLKGLIGVLQELSNNNKAVEQFMQEEFILKHIKKNVSLRDRALRDISSLVENIITRGVRQGVFYTTNPRTTAALLLMAFVPFYLLPEDEHAKSTPDFEEMFAFLMRALKNCGEMGD